MTERLKAVHILAGLILLAFYIAGCAGGGPARLPSPGLLSSDNAEVAEMKKGRALFVRECASCHRHFWPAEKSSGEWKETLQRHRPRVPLTEEQFDNLEAYVIRASEYGQEAR